MIRNYRGADLTGADLTGQDLVDADLRGARLAGARLAGVDLTRATLRGADLCGADLRQTILVRTDLTGVRTDVGTRWPEGFDPTARTEGVVVPLRRSFEERTENTFFQDGRLKQIPARNQRKLHVVLARLVEAFEPERRYCEQEVNAILTRFHPDCATLRRMLCDYRWMARQQGIYWRLRNVERLKAELRRVVATERQE